MKMMYLGYIVDIIFSVFSLISSQKDDFTIQLVARNQLFKLPFFYKITSNYVSQIDIDYLLLQHNVMKIM